MANKPFYKKGKLYADEIISPSIKALIQGGNVSFTQIGDKVKVSTTDSDVQDVFCIDNNEFLSIVLDASDHIIFAIKTNGDVWTDKLEELQKQLDNFEPLTPEERETLDSINPFKGKKGVWYGTSIPAQGYPILVADKLQMTIINESLGSSMCRCGKVTKGDAFGDDMGIGGLAWQNVCLSLSLTQEEKLRLFKRWTTDNRKALMISEDGYTAEQVANVVGYGNLLGGSFAGEDGHPSGLPSSKPIDFMYEGYVDARKMCYAASWNSSTDIEQGFGIIEGKVEKYLSSENCPDVWFLDHGHNDGFNADSELLDVVPQDPCDRSYFLGAMNFIISKILEFQPHAQIVLIGHYTNNSAGSGHPQEVSEAQQVLSEYWQFPLCKAWEFLPFSPSTKITTTGYWDSSGHWHDIGYDGTPSYSHTSGYNELTGQRLSTAFMGTNHYGEHYSGGSSNVRQVNGVWVHDLTMKQIWMKDDLHPNYKSKPLYASYLTAWIKANLLIL